MQSGGSGSIKINQRRGQRPETHAKYADAIARLKEDGLTTAKVAAGFGLHPECVRRYRKEHEPELHASLGMKKAENGKMVSHKSMEKYNKQNTFNLNILISHERHRKLV